jgi:hypothetical protein
MSGLLVGLLVNMLAGSRQTQQGAVPAILDADLIQTRSTKTLVASRPGPIYPIQHIDITSNALARMQHLLTSSPRFGVIAPRVHEEGSDIFPISERD